ncbi:MAG: Calx-beta domain-containing protein, partial [candidate division Zixibacteria bacterium]|nr:Calx-beta domain-containing protein [candidate division Zixibacteria bacterium]
VDLAVNAGSTAGGTDYTLSGTQITIAAGSTTGSVTVTGNNDAIYEGPETVIIDLTSVTNATDPAPAEQQAVTITDDDSVPTVTLSTTGSPIAENGGVATITATLSNATTQTVTVDLAVNAGSTAGGTDYTLSGTQITIAAGSTTGSVTLTGNNDAIYEGPETVIIDLTSVTNATDPAPAEQQTVTITDDDSVPTVTLSTTGSPIAENGGVATITATLSNPTTQTVTVDLAVNAGSTAGGTDYTLSGTQITIAAGSTTGTITVTGNNDAIYEGPETVIIDMTSVTNATDPAPAEQQTVTITDDDSAPTVSLSTTGSPIAENGGVATITATLSNATTQTVTVDLAV